MNAYWIYAENKTGNYPQDFEYGGKWLIFSSVYNAKRIWLKIKRATENGTLGNLAKMATAKPNGVFTNSKVRVICVYTYDWRDKDDVMRVREELRKIGITRKIAYKADEDTYRGLYSNNGDSRISKYFG